MAASLIELVLTEIVDFVVSRAAVRTIRSALGKSLGAVDIHLDVNVTTTSPVGICRPLALGGASRVQP